MSRAPDRYDSALAYAAARCKYAVLRGILRRAAHWTPLKNPQTGYTIIVGVPWQLWDLVDIPLVSLQKSRRTQCREVILAVDATERTMHERHGHLKIAMTVKSFSSLRPRIVYYTSRQEFLARRINWNWVDCWLTWVNGLAETSTRHALLHDFDAVVLDPDFCEKHYEIAVEANSTFVGIQRDPRHDGDQATDLLMTVEMMLDAAAIRSLFSPIDLFNCVRKYEGRRIQCDILRDVQLRLPDAARSLHTIRQDQLVHPSQVISQWRSLRESREPFAPQGYTPLFVVPYFRHVQGDSSDMVTAANLLERGEHVVSIEGSPLDVTQLDQPGRDWIADQIERLDGYFSGQPTPDVMRYTRAIRAAATSTVEAPIPDITIERIRAAESLQP